jgi:hypothetical protein
MGSERFLTVVDPQTGEVRTDEGLTSYKFGVCGDKIVVDRCLNPDASKKFFRMEPSYVQVYDLSFKPIWRYDFKSHHPANHVNIFGDEIIVSDNRVIKRLDSSGKEKKWEINYLDKRDSALVIEE